MKKESFAMLYDPYGTAKSEVVYRDTITHPELGPVPKRKHSRRPPLHSRTNQEYGSFSEQSLRWPQKRAEMAARASAGATRTRDPSRTRPHSVAGDRRRPSADGTGPERRDSLHSSGSSFFDRQPSRPVSADGRTLSRGSTFSATDSTVGTTDRSMLGSDYDGQKYEFWDRSWNQRPVFRTQRKMQQARKNEMKPHPSFDVDGDGAVSANDYYLASKFDVNNDGTLDQEEQTELRKTMVNILLKKYTEIPKADDEARQQFLQKYTKNLDRTVRSTTFLKELNILQQKTATAMDKDSTQMFQLLQPNTMLKHERKMRRAGEQAGDTTTRTAVSNADAHTAFKTAYSNNSGISSRESLHKIRREEHRRRMSQLIEADHKRYPAPGNAWQQEVVTGPPKIGHHKKGHW